MDDIKKLTTNKLNWVLYALATILSIGVIYFEWIIGVALTVIMLLIMITSLRAESRLKEKTTQYISTLSYRVKKVGEEALLSIPFGIILYSDEEKIEWLNPYMNDLLNQKETMIGHPITDISSALHEVINREEADEAWIELAERKFKVVHKKENRLIYLIDRTEQIEVETRHAEEETVIGIIYLDNYDELTQAMDDTSKSHLNSRVTSILNNWSNDYGIFLKRTSQDRFLAVMNRSILAQLEDNKFEILDEVRELISDQNISLTISIGIGKDTIDIPALGELAQSSLDLALGRGGDQVAVKDDSGKVKFYGGKTNPVEKRTRVRARVISHALSELIKVSDQVFIMGHKMPDMDAIGSCIGVLKIAQQNGKRGYVVFDRDGVNTGVNRLMTKIDEDESLSEWFISPDESLEMVTKDSIVIVVDTHKPSMVMEERLLNRTNHVVVIDHHRRAQEFVEDPTLVYMEPYASSTAELVTELIQYQPGTLKFSVLEASSLLAGIIVDTKSFALRTGSRTFDAASYLRSKGADTVFVQELLKEDIDIYVKRSELIKRARVYREGIAIAHGVPDDPNSTIVIAQAADTLLTMTGVRAAFVCAERPDGKIGVSARSLGEVNVQVIMESMNGGGHLTNAATQLEDTTIDQVVEQLEGIIDEYLGGGEEA